jgi:hypothetical protein
MTTSIDTLINNVLDYQYDPARIQSISLQMVTDTMDGTIAILNPTNPFVQALQVSSVHTAAACTKVETNTRLQYPRSALTFEDIYPHMSDKDFVGRFADAADAVFTMVFNKTDVLLKMVTDPDTGIKKVVIPRNSYFTVGGTDWSIQYPIEIRQLVHGGLSIVYDTTISSPLQDLTTNQLDWNEATAADGTPLLVVRANVRQFNIDTVTRSIDEVREFTYSTTLDDNFMYARVYSQNSDGTWTEMQTSHTVLTYDVTKPTALIKVLDKDVTVTIPYVYVYSGQVANAIRIDLYQTKGNVVMQLNLYPVSDYGAVWFATDKVRDSTVYSAPLKTIAVDVFSNSTVNGGRDALSFETLRQQVINNSVGSVDRPITPDQITNALEDSGYQLVKNIDYITNRVFLATKPMPTPTSAKLITAAAASIQTIALKMSVTALHEHVMDNGSSITLTPELVYRLDNGVMTIVPQAEIDALMALTIDQRALRISQNNYLFTPFYYVLDASDSSNFDLRPYYLSNPEAETKLFVSENDTTMMQVVTDLYTVALTDNGYTLRVVTKSDDAWKALKEEDVFVQLAFIPPGETNRAYLMGTLAGRDDSTNERIYDFDLSSNMNVDLNDNIQMTKFMMYNTDPKVIGTSLFTEFDIIYGTNATVSPAWTRAEVDDVLGTFLLTDTAKGITHEKIRVRFGYALDTLWARSRSMSSSLTYKKWAMDVPAYYTEDVYGLFPDGSKTQIVDGQVTYNITHHAGDPILDVDGNQVYEHKAGDVMLDANGDPIPEDTRAMLRQLDLMMIDGAYKFATDSISTAYLQELIDTVVTWITTDLEALQKKVLERTKIYFYPKVTMGDLDVIIDDGLKTTVPANQPFAVTLYVSKAVFENESLKATLSNTTTKTINTLLDQDVLAVSNFIAGLKTAYGDDVLGFEMSGFGSAQSISAMSIIDDSKRLSIKKRLTPQADETLIVQEDVTIVFKRQQVDS